jgi:chorismate mutase
MVMLVRGVRGATTADADEPEAIEEATRALLGKMIELNGIEEEYVASVIFTTSPDLTAAFPAKAARDLGWTRTALMGCQEMGAPGALPRCIRILVHWNTTRTLDEIVHVYMRDAKKLRPDIQAKNRVHLNGGSEG